jgi:hypothetical protein
MRRLTWRIPNVALSCHVDLAEERRLAPAKRKMYIAIPPEVTLDGEVYLEGQDGSLWLAEAVSALEAVAHEV